MLTPSNIKYWIVLSNLCTQDEGVHCVELARYLHVAKSSVHTMICSLCNSDFVTKERYGVVYLTEKGQKSAELYAVCFAPLCAWVEKTLHLKGQECRNAAYAILAQVRSPDNLARELHVMEGPGWSSAVKR